MPRPKKGVGRFTGNRAEAKDERTYKAENAYLKCPFGHALPHKGKRGNCTPLYCTDHAEDGLVPLAESPRAAQKSQRGFAAQLEAAETKEEKLAVVEKQELNTEEARLHKADLRRKLRRQYLDLPQQLEGAAAEEWATKKVISLVPDAVAEVEWQLKMGDDNQRIAAARDILDAAGMRKTDKGGGGVSPIIFINGGGGNFTLPWSQSAAQRPSAPSNQTVEGETASKGENP